MKHMGKKFKRLSLILAAVLLFANIAPFSWMENLGAISAEAASVKLSPASVTLIKGQKKTVSLKGTKAKAKWSSTKKNIASVDSKGKVTAKKKGTAIIKAKLKNKTYTCKITVEEPKLNTTSLSIIKGKSSVLKIIGTKQRVTWSSSAKKVASVTSNGKVTALTTGSGVITGKIGTKLFKCKITVLGSGGTLKGKILLNDAPDEDAQILLIPQNGRAKGLLLEDYSDWSLADEEYKSYQIYGTMPDEQGFYSIKNIPAGRYTCLLISGYYEEDEHADDDDFAFYFRNLLSAKTLQNLKEYVDGYEYSISGNIVIADEATVTLNKTFYETEEPDEDEDFDDDFDDSEDDTDFDDDYDYYETDSETDYDDFDDPDFLSSVTAFQTN